MGKFERKFGRYAIPNLTYIIVGAYALGILLCSIAPGVIEYLSFDPYYILKGQVWRLISWLLVQAPGGSGLSTIIMIIFYISIGRTLERVWGDFTYNVYIFSGLLFTMVGVFLVYLIAYFGFHTQIIFGASVTTYYICLSIFLAFAMTFPDAQVLLMFIIPIKVKWLGFLYAGMLVWQVLVCFFAKQWIPAVIIVFSVLNFIVFYLSQKKRQFGSPKQRVKQMKRRYEFNRDATSAANPSGIAKHKCAICGRTELTNPELEFRFCSKCNGNYEYCSDHLFTHKHVE